MYLLFYLKVFLKVIILQYSILNFAILSVFNVRNVIIWHRLGAVAPISLQSVKSLPPPPPHILNIPPPQYSEPCPLQYSKPYYAYVNLNTWRGIYVN